MKIDRNINLKYEEDGITITASRDAVTVRFVGQNGSLNEVVIPAYWWEKVAKEIELALLFLVDMDNNNSRRWQRDDFEGNPKRVHIDILDSPVSV